MTGADRKVVLGLGNILGRDEGLGVHALGPLRARLADTPGIEVLDGGVLGMGLLPIVESCSHLLLLDAVDAGRPPGTVIEINGPDIPLLARQKLSWHQLSFQEVLHLAASRDRRPTHLHLIGAQPADLSIGIGLSPEAETALPALVDRALAILTEWSLL